MGTRKVGGRSPSGDAPLKSAMLVVRRETSKKDTLLNPPNLEVRKKVQTGSILAKPGSRVKTFSNGLSAHRHASNRFQILSECESDCVINWIEREPQLNRVGEDDEFEVVESHLDSGAAKSVCPREWCAQFPVRDSKASKGEEHFRTATGARVKNEGDRIVTGWTDAGVKINQKFAVSDIAVPLESVSQLCDAGATILFHRTGGVIDGPAGKIPFERNGDTYVRKTWVRKVPEPETHSPKSGFPRQSSHS